MKSHTTQEVFNMKEKMDQWLSLRITAHDLKRLGFLAEEENRSVSSAARNILISYLDHFEKEREIWNRR